MAANVVVGYTPTRINPTWSDAFKNTFKQLASDTGGLFDISKFALTILDSAGEACAPFKSFKDFYGGTALIARVNDWTQEKQRDKMKDENGDWMEWKLLDRIFLTVAHTFSFVVFVNTVTDFLSDLSASFGNFPVISSFLLPASMVFAKDMFVIASSFCSVVHSVVQCFDNSTMQKCAAWQERFDHFNGQSIDRSRSELRAHYLSKIAEAQRLQTSAPEHYKTKAMAKKIPRWSHYIEKINSNQFVSFYLTVCQKKVQHYQTKAEADFNVNLINIIYQVAKIALVTIVSVTTVAQRGVAFSVLAVLLGTVGVVKWWYKGVVVKNIQFVYKETERQPQRAHLQRV